MNIDSAVNNPVLDGVEFTLGEKPAASVIWLHGLGDNAESFSSIAPFIKLPEQTAVRFIFLNAPMRPVTINNGIKMRAWYDLLSIDFEREVNVEHLQESRDRIAKVINYEIERGIASKRIIVAGFSQGAAMCLDTALYFNKPLLAFLALSGYLIKPTSLTAHDANLNTPILMHHGTLDDVVPEPLGRSSAQQLQKMGYCVDYQTYPSPHHLSDKQLTDVCTWLTKYLISSDKLSPLKT